MHVCALLAGVGTQQQELEALASDLGIQECIKFLGWVDSRQVLWASDALVLTSHKEGFPLVVAEAMLCGVVPIRTPAGGAADQIDDGHNGYLIPFDDDEALAARLLSLIRSLALRQRLSTAALEKSRTLFSLSGCAERTASVYEEVLRDR